MNAVLFSPVPRTLAHSSLGFQTAWAGLLPCERAVAEPGVAIPRTIETSRRLSDFDVVFASLAWEPEILPFVAALRASIIEPVRRLRDGSDPLVVAGGPVTLSNPDLLTPFCDAVFVGEADGVFPAIRAALSDAADRDDALSRLAAIPGMFVPALAATDACDVAPIQAPLDRLPARTTLPGEDNEFGGAFLVECGRGCPRKCTFCAAKGGGRKPVFLSPERILGVVPEDAARVGLLGASVSDHPHLLSMVETLVGRGAGVSLGSVRADKVTPELLVLLVRGGLRTLTIAADGLSSAVRKRLRKGLDTEDLERAVELGIEAGLHRVRIYVMIGVPGETGKDIEEFADLVWGIPPGLHVSVSVSPFVPKRFTPLSDAPFAGARDLKRRIAELKKAIGSAAEVRAPSPRESELEWRLSHARGEEAERLALDASTPDPDAGDPRPRDRKSARPRAGS